MRDTAYTRDNYNKRVLARRRMSPVERFFRRRGALVLCLVVVLFVALTSITVSARTSKATGNAEKKIYTSYTVRRGDNLYSIAKEHCDLSQYGSYEKYIKEVEEINHIQADRITAGYAITIPKFV